MTADGSHSLYNEGIGESYHSRHGALQESMHVFIEAGLLPAFQKISSTIHILEMGFGTGLNALLSLYQMQNRPHSIEYTSIEKYPVSIEDASRLNYVSLLNAPYLETSFLKMHSCDWNYLVDIDPKFKLNKQHGALEEFVTTQKFDLVYYDAFSPTSQPELWTVDVFRKLFSMMKVGGELVTYCSKGDVRRAMLAAGFNVIKMPGPKGKREMLKAVRK